MLGCFGINVRTIHEREIVVPRLLNPHFTVDGVMCINPFEVGIPLTNYIYIYIYIFLYSFV